MTCDFCNDDQFPAEIVDGKLMCITCKASRSLAPARLLACPWCDSEKVMAEGIDKRMAMVCQKCLARGPEVNVEEGRDAAIHEWNKALRHPPTPRTKWKCERCGMTAVHVWYGTAKRFVWKHIGTKGSRLNKQKTACDRVRPVQVN